ncbi:translation elongation factor Ts, partial [Gammaproteobacteria bacterium]|nr:translation elongation factor Ts [Gammaproteobacteria bacterium]
MSITASQVKELREMSGVGMMECKKALVETDGDLDKALDLLRANSSLKAEKKASRVAADGEIKIAENSEYFSLIEINSETDFAAKDSQFRDFAGEVAEYLINNKVTDIADLSSMFEKKRQSLIQSIGENIQLRRLQTLDVPSGGCIGAYLHSDGKLAAIVSIDTDNKELAKDLAMHVSATNPTCLQSEDIDPEFLERERSIFLAQAEESGKDASIMEKMVEGKVKRFLSEVT